MNQVFKTIQEIIRVIFDNFTNPDNRLYLLYLLSTGIIAFWVYFKTKQRGSFIKYIFNKKTWLSKSAQMDYSMLVFNSIIKVVLIGPYLGFGLYIAFYTEDYLARHFGYERFSMGTTEVLVLYTISITLINDFVTYILHYLLHIIPSLWEFHKVHHSATTMSPITQYRIHPVELILANVKETLVFGVLMGIFSYLSGGKVETITFLGINLFSFLFMFLGANLRHSSVKLKYFDFLEYIFMSPYQHQIHHSSNPEHFDKNMGSKLAMWDWMFGTLLRSKQVNKIIFGISKEENHGRKYESFQNNLLLPFTNILKLTNKIKSK